MRHRRLCAGIIRKRVRTFPNGSTSTGCRSNDKKFGAMTWGKRLVPTYLWYDGTRNASLVGDKINPTSP